MSSDNQYASVPRFGGDGSLTSEMFIQSVEALSVEDDRKVALVSRSLEGTALQWYTELDAPTKRDWDTLKEAMRDRFPEEPSYEIVPEVISREDTSGLIALQTGQPTSRVYPQGPSRMNSLIRQISIGLRFRSPGSDEGAHSDPTPSRAESMDSDRSTPRRRIPKPPPEPITVANADTLKCLLSFPCNQSWMPSVVFVPTGRRNPALVFGSHGSIRRWTLARRVEETIIHTHPDQAQVHCVSASRDGAMIASASEDKTVRLCLKEDGDRNTVTRLRHAGVCYSVAFSHDGTRLASGCSDGIIRIWSTKTCKVIARCWRDSPTRALAFSQDGTVLASGSEDASVCLWDPETEKSRAILRGHTWTVRGVSFSPDENVLASCSEDGFIRLWDWRNQTCLGVMSPNPRDPRIVQSIAFSPDGTMLVSASHDKSVRVWDVATRNELAVLQGHNDMVYSAAFSPDGSLIASASKDTTIRLWSLGSRRSL